MAHCLATALLALLTLTHASACTWTPPTELTAGKGASSEADDSRGEPFRIGAIFDITGPGSRAGVHARDSARLIEEQLNAQGGVSGPDGRLHPISLTIYDTGGQASQAAVVAGRLIEQDGVSVVIGPGQPSTAAAILDNVQSASVPLISTAAELDTVGSAEHRSWVFQVPPSHATEMQKLAKHLAASQLRNLALVRASEAPTLVESRQVAAMLTDAGLTLVANERISADGRDAPTAMGRVLAASAQAIIVQAPPRAAAGVVRAAREGASTLPIAVLLGNSGYKAFLEFAGPSSEGVMLPVGKILVHHQLPASDAQLPVLDRFTEAFEASDARSASYQGGHAWDAMHLAVRAMRKAGPDATAIRDWLEQEGEYVGVGGVYRFGPLDHGGLDESSLVVAQIRDGQYRLVSH